MYRETFAKVTIEILDPMVLQIKKDMKTTFTERLGVVGKKLKQLIDIDVMIVDKFIFIKVEH